jgi:signal transduction histidine kinase
MRARRSSAPNGSIRVGHVVKYAQARAVSVELTLTDDMFVATIADNGIGGSEPQLGSGLRGLVDRVHAVGGRL